MDTNFIKEDVSFLEYLINHLSDLKVMMNTLTQLKEFSYTLLMKTI